MKALLQIPLLMITMGFASCDKTSDAPMPADQTKTSNRDNTIPDGVPACIRDEIRRMQSEPVANPPASVWQYEYEGALVYYIPPQCCDEPSKLLDENCNHICSPDGGLTGKGDGKCPSFFDTRTNEKLIWKDER